MNGKLSTIGAEEAGTLNGLFALRVARSPDKLAYRQFERERGAWIERTWAEVADDVGRWQAAMVEQGLEPGDRVALRLRNCIEWIVFEQAALGLGLVVVPLYTDDRPDNVAYILEDAGVKLLLEQDVGRWNRLAPAVVDNRLLQAVWVLDAETAEIPDDPRVTAVADVLPEGSAPLQGVPQDRDSLATIVYTSGTTGRSKGVMLSHANILYVADAALHLVEIFEEDSFLSFLPLSHTLERTGGYYLPMMAGAEVSYARSVAQLGDDLLTIRPTVLVAVPRIFERVYSRLEQQLAKASLLRRGLFRLAVNVGWHAFERSQGRRWWGPKLLLNQSLQRLVASKVQERLGGRLRIAVSGGAALSAEIARIFVGLGVQILQGYGLTETSPVISVNLPARNDPTSVGPPLVGLEVRLGPERELQVKGPGVMLGYWNNHAATAEMIDREGWLSTGDQAKIENGFVYITGRIKDILVLSNGEKVPPGDMELAICLDPLFEQAMVIGEGQRFLGALLVLNQELWPKLARECAVAPDDPDALNSKAVLNRVSRRLTELLHDFPGYAKIRRIHLELEPWSVDNGLMTPTMKVKRPKVLERYTKVIEAMYAGND